MVKTVREKFSLYTRPVNNGERISMYSPGGGSVTSATSITTDISNYLISKTRPFLFLSSQDLYEHLFIHEPEVAAVVNKVSEMVASSFKNFTLIDNSEVDNIAENINNGEYDNTIPEINDNSLLKEMLDTANEISRSIDITTMAFELYSTIMEVQGEVFLAKNNNHTLTVLPNNRITIIDNLNRINTGSSDPRIAITEENYLVFDEGLPDTQKIYTKNQFIHIKLNDVPINIEDCKSRHTYGIYGISPLERAIIPLWMRRQVYIIETLWRWANVPREQHMVDATAFNPNQYNGTPQQKMVQAQAALQKYIDQWSAKLRADTPDMKYVTSSNLTIKNIEHTGSSYMDSNGLLTQIETEIWDGLGMPQSIVRGNSDGSYASSLVTASGASLRVEQIARKIGRVVLQNMKERLLDINPNYPVNHLDIKIKFEFAPSLLDQLKSALLMKQIGDYTATEIRSITGHLPLTDEQKAELDEVVPTKQKVNNLPKSSKINNNQINYPTTPHSADTQTTDGPESNYKNILYPPSVE